MNAETHGRDGRRDSDGAQSDEQREKLSAAGPAVRVIETYRVRPGHAEAFERAIEEARAAACARDGCRTFEVLPPVDKDRPSDDEYRVTHVWEDEKSWQGWETSDPRKARDAAVGPMLRQPVDATVLTGTEVWHTWSGRHTVVTPPKYKLAFLNWLSLFPLALMIGYATQAVFGDGLPLWARSLLLSVIIIPVKNFVVMPRMARLFAGWLYPRPEGTSEEDARKARDAADAVAVRAGKGSPGRAT